MDNPIRVLIVEDTPIDYELAQREIRRAIAGSVFENVDTREGFLAALDTFAPDLIVSDYNMPGFDGLTALILAQEHVPLTPFIIWTGSLNEDTAVACMKAGAVNYVLKEQVKRLGPAVVHALEEKKVRVERFQMEQALRENETRFRALIESSSDAIVLVSTEGIITFASASTTRITGYAADEFVGHSWFEFIHLEDVPSAMALLEKLVHQPHEPVTIQYRQRHSDGTWRWMEVTGTNLLGEPSVQAIVANYHDITKRKHAEEAEREQRILAQALRDTAAALNSTLDFDTVLDQILENASRVVPHDASTIMLREGDSARIVRSRGYQTEGAEGIRSLRLEVSQTRNLEEMAETGQPLVIADTRAYPGWRETPATLEQRSAVAAPIVSKGKLIGFISLDSFTPNSFTPKDAEALLAFADQAAVAMENARLLREAQGRANEFATLYEMARALTQQKDLTALLQTIVERATALLNVPSGELLLYDPQWNELQVAVAQNIPAPPGTRLKMGEGLAGRTAFTRAPMIVDDFSTAPYRVSNPETIPVKALILVPLLSGGELMGVLGVGAPKNSERQFTEADVQLLSLLTGPAASAIQNARLLEQMEKRLEELQAFNKISTALRAAHNLDEMLPMLLDETIRLFEADSGSIWLYDPKRDELHLSVHKLWEDTPITTFKRGEGLPGYVLATGAPYLARNLKQDLLVGDSIRPLIPEGISAAAVPIRAHEEIIGVLFVTVFAPREFAEEQVNLLTTIAEIAGTAIQRTRLFEQTHQQLERLSALRSIDLVISGSLDLRLALNVVLEQTVSQLRVDAAAILLLNAHTGILEYAAGRGFRTREIERTRLRLGEGYAGRAALERILVSVPLLGEATQLVKRAALGAIEGFFAYYVVPLIVKGQIKGVLEVWHRAPLTPDENWLGFFEALAGQAAIAIDNAELFEKLQRSNLELALAYDTTLEGWSRALDLRDHETEGHTERVTEVTTRLARAMGVDELEIVHLRRGALLHDIGKMGIPDSILLKPGPLTDDEWEIMRKHPVYAFELLSQIAYLRPALDIPYAHHEKWDGTGYPRGLKGEEIPFIARIFAVVDVWDALCSDRPYRKAWDKERVREYVQSLAGTHFEPKVVNAFLELEASEP